MGSFLKDNGENGVNRVYRTATGYICGSSYLIDDEHSMIQFFIRNVVGDDGLPYIDVGFMNLSIEDKDDGLEALKNSFYDSGFVQVNKLSHNDESHYDNNQFIEHKTPNKEAVSLRFSGVGNDIEKIILSASNIIETTSLDFIQTQESVPDNLEKSILAQMGNELSKGPGGIEKAKDKARQLAHDFKFGYNQEALVM